MGWFKRTALKHVYYLEWNRSPAQVGCMRQVLGPGALGRPRGIGWRGRWEGGLGWGTHVNPWLIHVNVWQKPLQYCKVISLQLIKINEKKISVFCISCIGRWTLYHCATWGLLGLLFYVLGHTSVSIVKRKKSKLGDILICPRIKDPLYSGSVDSTVQSVFVKFCIMLLCTSARIFLVYAVHCKLSNFY